MALNDTLNLSGGMLARRQRLIAEKYPELANPTGYPSMTSHQGLSPLGKFLSEEHGPLGIRLGDFTPASYGLAMRDVQQFGAEAEAAGREGNSFQEYMNRALQGVSALGVIPALGAITRPIAGAGKKTAMRLAERFPDLGEKFGPRQGFYSKLERAVQEMPQAMKAEDFLKYLKDNKRIKQAEIDSYDIETLIRNEKKITPDMAAEWAMNRRPDYTETRRAGTERSWEAYENARNDLTNEDAWEPDMDAFSEWRAERTDQNVDGDMDNYSFTVDPIEDADGNVRYEVYDGYRNEPAGTYDTRDAAEDARYEAEDSAREAMRESYNDMSDDDFVNAYHRSAYNVRQWAESEHATIPNEDVEPPEDLPPRFWQDPGEDVTDDPMSAEMRGRWGQSHYSPAKGRPEFDQDYVELIQQMPPIGRIHNEALLKEMPAPDPYEESLREMPLFESMVSEGPPNWRQKEIARIPSNATRDWKYTTHWDEPNPVEHIRGYYNVPEVKTRIEDLPGARYKPVSGPFDNPDEALAAGYTYRVNVEPAAPGQSQQYTMDIMAPDGTMLEAGRRIWSPVAGRGGTGGIWPSGNPEARNEAIERHVRTNLNEMANRDWRDYNRRIGPRAAEIAEPTGKKGLFMSEIQADLEQQAKREYYPWKKPVPPTREELQAQGWEVRPAEAELDPEAFFGQGARERDIQESQYTRLANNPQFHSYVAGLPRAQQAEIVDALDRLRERRTGRADPWTLAYRLDDAARAAGVPEELLPTIPQTPRGQGYDWGRRADVEHIVPDPALENAYTPSYTGGQIVQQLLLPEVPGGPIQTPRFHRYGGNMGGPEAAWADALEHAAQQQGRASGNAPRFPLDEDYYQLALKRGLLEAAATDQDFLMWNTPQTMAEMNSARGQTLFPNLYGEKGYLATGDVAKQLGLKGKVEPTKIDMPNFYLGEDKLEGFKFNLDEKLKKKILEEGFPLWMLPFLGVSGGLLGAFGTGEEPRYD